MKAIFEKNTFPRFKGMKVTFQLEGEINISPYVAQQRVNQFLIMNLPNLIMADEPDFMLSPNGSFWQVPIVLTNPEQGIIGIVGKILVDANTGIIEQQHSTPLTEIESNAKNITQKRTF